MRAGSDRLCIDYTIHTYINEHKRTKTRRAHHMAEAATCIACNLDADCAAEREECYYLIDEIR